MDVRRAPGVAAVAPRICAGFDRPELVVAVRVREHPPATAEVRIDGSEIGVLLVAVPATGVGLPHLDECALDRIAELVLDEAVDDDALTDRQAVLREVQDQVVVEAPSSSLRKTGPVISDRVGFGVMSALRGARSTDVR